MSSNHCLLIASPQYLQTTSFSTFGKCTYGNKCFSKFCKFSHQCWKPCKFDKSCKNDFCRFQHSVNFCSLLPECITTHSPSTLIECVQTGKEYYCSIQKVVKTNGTTMFIAFTIKK